MKTVSCFYLIAFVFFLGINSAHAQKDKRATLEKRRQELRAEINQINSLLSSNKKKGQSILTQAEDLNRRISATEKLIATNNQEANLLTNEINTNQTKISKLRKELEKLKTDYAQMIRKSYKSRSTQSRIMFLFSSESFFQAYKRLQYMKQYTSYRKKQGEKIKEQTKTLQTLNIELSNQRKDKEKLLAENRATRKDLEKDKKEQQALMATIRKQEGKYKKQIDQKQQEISKIDAQIQKLIRDAIASENEKKGSQTKSSFKMTPEAKALAANFKANKGRLPWPVKTGNISVRFGKHPSPLVKKIHIQSNGIRIETNKMEAVHAIFDGKIIGIQVLKGANKAILILHGNYISVYNNLAEIDVENGDVVTTGQIIGRVGISTVTHRPTLSFLIYKNTTAMDPQQWILKQ